MRVTGGIRVKSRLDNHIKGYVQTKLCKGLVKRDIFLWSAALNVTTA